MDAYMYKADLYCEDCIILEMQDDKLLSPGKPMYDTAEVIEMNASANGWLSEEDYDSDEFPKGPYPDGGGEADCPQHCGRCEVFLENPLTMDGVRYVSEAIREFDGSGKGNKETIETWREYYAIKVDAESEEEEEEEESQV